MFMGKEMVGTVFIIPFTFGAETELQSRRILLRPSAYSTPVPRSRSLLLRRITIYHPPLFLPHSCPEALGISGDHIKDHEINQRRHDQQHTHNTPEISYLDAIQDLYGIKSKIEISQPLRLHRNDKIEIKPRLRKQKGKYEKQGQIQVVQADHLGKLPADRKSKHTAVGIDQHQIVAKDSQYRQQDPGKVKRIKPETSPDPFQHTSDAEIDIEADGIQYYIEKSHPSPLQAYRGIEYKGHQTPHLAMQDLVNIQAQIVQIDPLVKKPQKGSKNTDPHHPTPPRQ